MKHIVFGGNGLVGRHLAERLVKDGEEVVVCDIVQDRLPHYAQCQFTNLDVTDKAQFMQLDIQPDDVVYNLATTSEAPRQTRARRHALCWPVNYHGTANIIEKMADCDANRLIHFSTDKVYGHSVLHPKTENHPANPVGEYGLSKKKSEELAALWREKGMQICVFRPRPVLGPGRLSHLTKLFRLVEKNLPIPMIGSGRRAHQFVSVFDCAEAARLAWKSGVPNETYNLGSDNPPSERVLLADLIGHAGSKSMLLPTPAWAVKRTLDLCNLLFLPTMDPEHYLIADEARVLDCSRAKQQLGWSADFHDTNMVISAYEEYCAGRAGQLGTAPAATKTTAAT